MKDNLQFIGIGWSFPPEFDQFDGTVAMTTGDEDIRKSLFILLSTTLGERVMHPAYGCNLRDYVFDPVNGAMETYIKKLVQDAIIYYEPRITLQTVTVDFNDVEGVLWISIEYLIDATNSRANYVYPYYIQEGSNV